MEQQEKKFIAQCECRRLHSLGVGMEICQKLYSELMNSTEFRFELSIKKLKEVKKDMGNGFKIKQTKTASGTGIDMITVHKGTTIFWIQNKNENEKEMKVKDSEIDIMDYDISPATINIYD